MPRRLTSCLSRLACETERKLKNRASKPNPPDGGSHAHYRVVLCAVLAVILLGMTRGASAQPEPAPATAAETRSVETPATPETAAPGAAQEAAGHEEGAEAEHAEEGLLPVVARLVNFAILVGTLVYLLRSPFATYLTDRGTQIRSDLVNAAEMKQAAAAQLEEIDRKMKALPGELEALRSQGAQEITAEAARIRAAAAAERDRLLEQARRDIDNQVKVAERELVSHAANLAVGVAEQRIKNTITDDDQKRLADQYVQQLKG